MTDTLQQVRAYHQRSKHYLDAYARGPETLDWDHQPDPFRRFTAAALQQLPLIGTTQLAAVAAFNRSAVGALLELSMGLSAWKQFGPQRWALRCNPSSGNLHPTEAYVIANGIEDLTDGVYHYAAQAHALEQRAVFEPRAATQQLLIGLSSIPWREAWKYGERAFRYVQLDVGHAIGAIRYAAGVLGWQVTLVPLPDEHLAALLGLDRDADFSGAERENPDVLLHIQPKAAVSAVHYTQPAQWTGCANALGGLPRNEWSIIEQMVSATRRVDAETVVPSRSSYAPAIAASRSPSDWIGLIKQRRSAQAFSPETSSLSNAVFYRMLNAVLPRASQCPWDSWNLPAHLHLLLFVHRVEGLPPGLYLLPRRDQLKETLQAAMSSEFSWLKVESCASHLALYQLLHADVRKTARTLSCHQEIASSSAFSLAMLAEFDSALKHGPHRYRELYWEAGLIGQVLYLEAEAVGMRGTGIGCFFDDSVHQLLGLSDTQFQSLYHFTVGDAKIDQRLQTLPPYSPRASSGSLSEG